MKTLRLLLVTLTLLLCTHGHADAPRRYISAGQTLMFFGTLALTAGAITAMFGYVNPPSCPVLQTLGGKLDAGIGGCDGTSPLLVAGAVTLSFGIATAGGGVALYSVGRQRAEAPLPPRLELTATPLLETRF